MGAVEYALKGPDQSIGCSILYIIIRNVLKLALSRKLKVEMMFAGLPEIIRV